MPTVLIHYKVVVKCVVMNANFLIHSDGYCMRICSFLPRWWLHLIVVRRFEYASDPESYTSGSVATGRVSLAGQVKG